MAQMPHGSRAKSVILLEANEIPPRLVEDHVRRHPDSAIARLLRSASVYETICADEIELDPWISWPTLHRGVNDTHHGILHLGQSLDWADKTYPPIWRLLHEAGVKTGLFGSLHSSATPEDAEAYAFYVPDFFAAEAYAHPKDLLPFQEFNLVMTRRSARNVDTGLPLREALAFGAGALSSGLTLSTMRDVATHLASERLNPKRKIRRRNLQPVIGLDLFLSLVGRTQPAFASFYTNHVAAAMHRYWGAHFTDDYGPENPMGQDWINTYRDELPHAMMVFDDMVGKVMRAVEARGDAILMVASSLGQAAVQGARETSGFTTVTDVGRLMDFIGVDRADWREHHAMVPCVSVDLNPDKAEEIAAKLDRLEVMGVRSQRSVKEIPPLSFDLKNGRSLHLYFYFEGEKPVGEARFGNTTRPVEEAGFGFFVHEDNVACSAHHIPDGVLWIYDPATRGARVDGAKISTLSIAPALLEHFGVARPAYMSEPTFAIDTMTRAAIAAE